MTANGAIARAAIRALAESLPSERTASPIDTALDGAILTARERRDPALVKRNAAILQRLNG